MSDVVLLVLHQSGVVRVALYVASLTVLATVGGVVLSRLIDALDAVGAVVAENRDWQITNGLSSKDDLLHVFAVAIYSALLMAFEPSLRVLISAVGHALVTTLILAPIAGAMVLRRRA